MKSFFLLLSLSHTHAASEQSRHVNAKVLYKKSESIGVQESPVSIPFPGIGLLHSLSVFTLRHKVCFVALHSYQHLAPSEAAVASDFGVNVF